MDVAVVLRGKSMRYLTGDMAILVDSVVEVWFTIYWGLHGHLMGTAAGHAHGLRGQRGQILKVLQSAQICLVLSP